MIIGLPGISLNQWFMIMSIKLLLLKKDNLWLIKCVKAKLNLNQILLHATLIQKDAKSMLNPCCITLIHHLMAEF